jgi:hypothetical protein
MNRLGSPVTKHTYRVRGLAGNILCGDPKNTAEVLGYPPQMTHVMEQQMESIATTLDSVYGRTWPQVDGWVSAVHGWQATKPASKLMYVGVNIAFWFVHPSSRVECALDATKQEFPTYEPPHPYKESTWEDDEDDEWEEEGPELEGPGDQNPKPSS